MRNIPADTLHEELVYPRAQDLASAMGNHGVDVVGTPALILYFEAAANNLALPFYEQGEISVGTHVCIDHLAPASGAAPVRVTAKLLVQKGRRLEFEMACYQGDTVIMTGMHHRAVMRRDKFENPQGSKAIECKTIDFWFDFHSPWCYFASHRIGEIAQQSDAKINWLPVHLANLSIAIDGRRPLEANSRFVSWYQQDQYDTAALCGLPFAPHQEYPLRPSRALRAAIFAAEQGLAEPFVKRVMRGYWAEQQDISNLDWLAQVAKATGLDGTATREAATSDEYRTRLNNQLDQAVEQNLFGLPAAVVDGKIFWGNDRLDLLVHYLSGKEPIL